jgi:hypothetical protein
MKAKMPYPVGVTGGVSAADTTGDLFRSKPPLFVEEGSVVFKIQRMRFWVILM